MREIIFSDFKMYIRSGRLWIAIIMANLICCFELYQNSLMNDFLLYSGTYNVFLYSFFFASPLFNFVAPVIATIPFSIRLYEELDGGYAKNLFMKLGSRTFILSRLVSTAVSGAITFSIILLIQFLISFIICPLPSIRIDYMGTAQPFTEVYMKSMLGYSLVVFINSVIFGASYAVFSMSTFVLTRNRIIGYFLPALFYSIGVFIYGNTGMAIFPFCTLQFYLSSTPILIKDHLLVFSIGILTIIMSAKHRHDCY